MGRQLVAGLSGVVTRITKLFQDLRQRAHVGPAGLVFEWATSCDPSTVLILIRFAAVFACSHKNRASSDEGVASFILIATPMAPVLSERKCVCLLAARKL